MPIQFGEKPDSRGGSGGTSGTESRKYFLHGTTDRNYVQAFTLAATPSVITSGSGILYRQDPSYEVTGPYWDITVPYAKQQKEVGTYTISFDTTGGTVNMKASYSTVARYPNPGATDHKGAINYTKDGVEGCEVIIPSLKLTVAYRHPAGIITLSQIKNLARNSGKVNSDTFLSFAAGEVLFLGATGSQSESEVEVSYQFACSENAVGLTIGEIAGVAKNGWDYAWVEFDDDEDAADNPIKKPVGVHVERVYRRTSLSTVLGFGG